MARKSKRAALVLTAQQRATLKELAGSRSAPTREVERAKVMLGYADGLTVTELQRQLGFSRPMIYRYVRHGTVSILAGIDLHSGHVFANVEERHRSVEFIALLRQLDAHYPQEAIIRVVLDNHSAHISKETMAWLGTRPGRFEYVHTPKHGSWLNLIECAFSKMARTFLRHIRVTSKDELKARILKGIAEINAAPVVFRWNKFDLGVV